MIVLVEYVDKIILKMIEEGLYVVDIRNGHVYSTRRGNQLKRLKGHTSKSRGYVRIDIIWKGKRYSASVHRMVWIAKHIDVISEDMVVDHINDIRTDNYIDNLRLIEYEKNHWKNKLEENNV